MDISTRDLFGKRRSELPSSYGHLFYARAWLLTHYLMSDNGRRQKLNTYTRTVGEGGDLIKSLEEALGYDMRTLDKNLREYMRGRIFYTSFTRKDVPVPMTVTTLPASADAVLLDKVRLLNGVPAKHASETLEAIEERARRYPNDRFAQLVLARAHIMLGDPAAAEPILQPYVADPADTEALFLMGLRYARMAEKELSEDALQAEAEERENSRDEEEPLPEVAPDQASITRALAWYGKARPWLAKANRANPESYEILYAYARTRRLDEDYPTDGTLDILAAAYQRAPQVEPIAMANAKALIAKGRTEMASRLLRMLANEPHGGAAAKEARALLDSLPKAEVGKPN